VKGSARMAGAMRLGQHCHEIETHIENMVHAGPPRRTPSKNCWPTTTTRCCCSNNCSIRNRSMSPPSPAWPTPSPR
jgi:HPt (histidine-containing phosphotransfer) domain-containing protein